MFTTVEQAAAYVRRFASYSWVYAVLDDGSMTNGPIVIGGRDVQLSREFARAAGFTGPIVKAVKAVSHAAT